MRGDPGQPALDPPIRAGVSTRGPLWRIQRWDRRTGFFRMSAAADTPVAGADSGTRMPDPGARISAMEAKLKIWGIVLAAAVVAAIKLIPDP